MAGLRGSATQTRGISNCTRTITVFLGRDGVQQPIQNENTSMEVGHDEVVSLPAQGMRHDFLKYRGDIGTVTTVIHEKILPSGWMFSGTAFAPAAGA